MPVADDTLPDLLRDALDVVFIGINPSDRPEIEALVVPGGNFPTMSFVAAWEREFGKPVITTNQAALWAMMGIMGCSDKLSGLGRLLEAIPAA